MPIGILIELGAVLIGSIIGSFCSKKISKELKLRLVMLIAMIALSIGVISVIKVESLPLVIILVLLGTLIGELIHFEEHLKTSIRKLLSYKKFNNSEENVNWMLIVVMIFCFSGTGIFGALNEGLSSDASVIISKSVLDFTSAIIYSSILGFVSTLVVIPQAITLFSCYLLGSFAGNFVNTEIINNFVAVGGVITLVLNLNIITKNNQKVLNTIFAMPIVVILNYIIISI